MYVCIQTITVLANVLAGSDAGYLQTRETQNYIGMRNLSIRYVCVYNIKTGRPVGFLPSSY